MPKSETDRQKRAGAWMITASWTCLDPGATLGVPHRPRQEVGVEVEVEVEMEVEVHAKQNTEVEVEVETEVKVQPKVAVALTTSVAADANHQQATHQETSGDHHETTTRLLRASAFVNPASVCYRCTRKQRRTVPSLCTVGEKSVPVRWPDFDSPNRMVRRTTGIRHPVQCRTKS